MGRAEPDDALDLEFSEGDARGRHSGEGLRLGRSLLAAQSEPPVQQVLDAPYNCSGWPQRRIYIESQAWYTRPGGDVTRDSARIMVGACVPHRQKIWGDLTLHILVQKFHFPDDLTAAAPVDIRVNFSSMLGPKMRSRYKVTSKALRSAAWQCAGVGPLCRAVLPITIKTYTGSVLRASIPDGFSKMTLVALTRSMSDGRAARLLEARIDTYLVVDNRGTQSLPSQALGIEQMAVSDFPWGQTHADLRSDMPTTAIKGTWSFDVKHFIYFRARRSSNVTSMLVSVDPDWTGAGVPYAGRVVFENTPAAVRNKCPLWKGMSSTCNLNGLQVDTTKLQRGAHWLFLRTDSATPREHKLMANSRMNGGTFAAATMISFSVCGNNPGEDDAECNEPDPPPPVREPVPDLPPILPPDNATTWYKPGDALPDQSDVITAPYDCSKWRGSRIYLEGQTWFTRPGEDPAGKSAQIQVGSCLPHKQPVAGVIPLDIMLGKYYLPSNMNAKVEIRVSFIWLGGNTTLNIEEIDVQEGWNCGVNTEVCKKVYRSLIDTRPESKQYYIPDGLTRVLLWASVTLDDGVTSRWIEARAESHMVVQNNIATTLNKALPPAAISRTIIPWKDTRTAMTTALPLAPVTGNLEFGTKHSLGGKIGVNVTGVFIALDPALTAQPPSLGHVILSAASDAAGGPASPPPAGCTQNAAGDGFPLTCAHAFNVSEVPLACPINPCAGGLCDGLHRLVIRTDYLVAASNPLLEGTPPKGRVGGGTLSTVVVVPIVTSNGIQRNDALCPAALAPAGLSGGPAGASMQAGGGFLGRLAAAGRAGVDAADASKMMEAAGAAVAVDLVPATQITVAALTAGELAALGPPLDAEEW
ncbi:MAG: hypothetical protein J3K34DRAFT_519093 [Monoraphidium minutum]|nr:MAG: hypothetical protein J3K34DRAFT_519093 [Monoraphidium minutum]